MTEKPPLEIMQSSVLAPRDASLRKRRSGSFGQIVLSWGLAAGAYAAMAIIAKTPDRESGLFLVIPLALSCVGAAVGGAHYYDRRSVSSILSLVFNGAVIPPAAMGLAVALKTLIVG